MVRQLCGRRSSDPSFQQSRPRPRRLRHISGSAALEHTMRGVGEGFGGGEPQEGNEGWRH